MTEYTLTVPTGGGYKIADYLYDMCAIAGGSTLLVGVGSWLHPDTGERVNENVGQHVHIVPYEKDDEFVTALNRAVGALHHEGEHTVLVRRLSGRGLVHFFLTEGMEVPKL